MKDNYSPKHSCDLNKYLSPGVGLENKVEDMPQKDYSNTAVSLIANSSYAQGVQGDNNSSVSYLPGSFLHYSVQDWAPAMGRVVIFHKPYDMPLGEIADGLIKYAEPEGPHVVHLKDEHTEARGSEVTKHETGYRGHSWNLGDSVDQIKKAGQEDTYGK